MLLVAINIHKMNTVSPYAFQLSLISFPSLSSSLTKLKLHNVGELNDNLSGELIAKPYR